MSSNLARNVFLNTILGIFWLASCLPVQAEPLALVQSLNPVNHTFVDRRWEMGGLNLGMSVADVKANLDKAFGAKEVESETNQLSAAVRDRTISSKPYTWELSASSSNAVQSLSADVHFAAPTIGSPATTIDYVINYYDNNSAPTLDQLFDQYKTIFGAASCGQVMPQPNEFNQVWVFGSFGPLLSACNHATVSPYRSLETVDQLKVNVASGARIAVLIHLLPSKKHPTQVRQASVIIEDMENELNGLIEAKRQLEAAAAAQTP